MVTLISLIGEQPIPNLLPIIYLKPEENVLLYSNKTENAAKRLEKLIQVKNKVPIDPYDIDKIMSAVNSKIDKNAKWIFNITGGTKVMSVALFKIALDKKVDFVYLQSEGNQSLLFKYSFHNSNIIVIQETMPELINVDTYLKAHIFDYQIDNRITKGTQFENLIAEVLSNNHFEVVQNVRPKGEGSQLEIDLVFRLKGTNNVAIAEIKTGVEGPKKGIDQLALAAQREYLGIYTKRFLITSSEQLKRIKDLASAHGIIVVDGININKQNNTLTEESKQKLINRIKEKLT